MTVNTRLIRFVSLVLLSLVLIVTASWATGPATASLAAGADAPTSVPYQGRLTADDGRPVADGSYDFAFTLYEAETGGAPLWTETLAAVAVQDGYFGVLLGRTAPLGMDVAAGERYLAVTVRGPGDADYVALEPRQKLVSPQATLQQPNCPEGTDADHDHCGDAWMSCSGLAIYGEQDGSAMIFVENTGASDSTKGVWGYATSFSGQVFGLYGQTNSSTGGASGVYGLTHSGPTSGVYGRTFSSADYARGVYGYASATSGRTYGVYGRTDSSTDLSYAVLGDSYATSGQTYGVRGETSSPEGRGVYGGAWGSSDTDRQYGVRGYSQSNSGRGMYGYADAASGDRIGVGGSVNGTGYGLYTTDNLYVGGTCTGCTLSFLAQNAGPGALQVGDVVAASGVGAILQGHTTPVLEVHQATADDLSVLGVVYARGEFYAALGDDPEDFGDSVQPVEGDVAPGDYLLVVTSGLAQVRIAPVSTGLAAGQWLAAGDVAGRAAPAGAGAHPDLVFARVMDARPDESGLLWAMIDVR